MKKIIVLFALLLGSIISIAQPVTQRGTSAVTVQDSRLFAEFNFRPPAFPDTIRANQQIGLDSCGALIFSRDINAYYYRACSPKRWVRVASGGSTSDSAYLSYRPLTDSTFLLCRVGGTRCDTIKVNGKGVTEAWLLGGNLNPKFNTLGTTSTQDVVIITNDVARMKIAGNGINRSSAARNRYLMIDTLTRYLFYGDESDTTAWKLLGNSNAIAGTSFLGTTNNIPLEFRVKNIKSGIIDSNYRNTALGYASQRFSQATVGTDSALYNTSMGFRALGANIYGDQNTSIGYAANALGTNLKGNTAIGYGAGAQNRTSSFDVAVGWGALPRNYYGYANTAVGADIANIAAPGVGDTMTYNTMLGYGSAYYKYTGRNNVFVGDSTGANNTTGSRNVFIGSRAGKNETGSDKLYISNSSISNPLIKGNFADSTLNVNGKMSISLTSQTPDSSLDVTGGVKLRTIYRSSALTDSMLLVGADGGVVKREVIVPSNTNVTRIISGSAVWDSLLIYSVTKCFYYINGILYNSAATNVTLAAADSSNPRIDVIYCDTLGNVGVITGIPSPDPVKPTVNPLSQIELTHINVNAQGTTPAGVSQRIIYNENVGVPNEWNTSTDVPASGVDFAYTVNPYVGIKSAFAPAYFNSNYSLIFTNNAFVNADTLSELSMYLRQNSAPPAARAGTTMFSIILLKSGVQITKPVLVSDGLYGYSLLTLNSYQHLAVPFSDFLFKNALDKTFDQIQIILESSVIPKAGYQFDYITAGAGGTPPAVTSDYWTLSGNDNTSFPNAKLGTTSKDQLSIVTDDIERINITNAGIISIPQLQTTTDTLLYKPLVINPTNGQVANIGNWGNNIVYTENPIMSRTSGDSNIIYFNPDTANVWRGGGSGTTPNIQQVLTVGDSTNKSVNFYNSNLSWKQNTTIQNDINQGYPSIINKVYSLDSTTGIYSLIEPLGLHVNSFDILNEEYKGITINKNQIIFGQIGGGASSATLLKYGTNQDEGAYNLYMPSYNSVATDDTLATLRDLRNNGGGGGSQNLQQVTDIGNSTTTDLLIGNNLKITDDASGNRDLTLSSYNTGNLVVSRNAGFQYELQAQNLTAARQYELPDADGKLLLDAPENGSLYGRKDNAWTIVNAGGTVTDISQGYGITASPTNPITVSGTITVDTSVSGLSGKYLRIIDGWNLKGNSGTSSTTDFLGTTDNQDLVFKRNNSSVGIYRNNRNQSIGGGATVGSITGTDNLAFGNSDMSTITSGSYNMQFNNSGTTLTTGSDNIFFGTLTGYNTTTGTGNLYMGRASGINYFLSGARTGNYNVMLGHSTGQSYTGITTGHNNTFLGTASGNNFATTSSNNVLVGDSVEYQDGVFPGTTQSIGNRNIIIGSRINSPDRLASNQLDIGNLIFGTNLDGTYRTISSGKIGIGVTTPLDKFHVAGTARVTDTLKLTGLQSKTDTTANKPLAIDASGNVVKMSNWVSGGGLGTVYVDSIYRTAGKDSFFYKKNGNTYAIKDSVGTNPAPVGYYGAFQDTTIQVAATINTPYAMKLGVTDLSNAVTIVSDGSNLTRITIANTGIYNIQFSAQFDRTNSGTDAVDIWLRKNGVNVAGSGGKIILTGGAAQSALIATWNYVLDVTAGDYYQLMWSTPDTHVRLLYETAQTSPFVHPLIPSLILTVTQQSGIMAGTGITAINSLTGAAQTMVTGTDSSDFKIVSTGSSHTFNLPTASATKRGALSSSDWSTFNGKIGASDTSVFQRKSISSYTMLANNTNATGNATAQTFRDTAGTYAGTITWTGTAPTTQTINAYQWQQTGKMVRLQLFGYYTNAGALATSVSLTIPADCPAPDISMFTSGALAILYQGIGGLGLSNTSLTTTTNAYMRRNLANNGNELLISAAAANYRRYQIDITYRAQ